MAKMYCNNFLLLLIANNTFYTMMSLFTWSFICHPVQSGPLNHFSPVFPK